MLNLYIEDYESILIDPATGVSVPMVHRFVTAQSIPLNATSSTSAQTLPQTRFVAITADANCRFAIAALSDATASRHYLPAGQIRFFKIYSRERLSAIGMESQ